MIGRSVISIVAAMDRNRVIGVENRLPWLMPADMKRFRDLTIGKPILMGRKTFESILASLGKPLPNRLNIILTRDQNYKAPNGCRVVHSVDDALAMANGAEEVMVAGGADIFQQFLPYADSVYMTEIDSDFEGDASFPEMPETEWRRVQSVRHEPDEKNPHPYSFQLYVRKEKLN
ncbi:MAG: dihydrofolate reductase [Candidatus Colwellbacteria bacterium]|nr:dihydrofolate reductase [Candidatus Colwellbacteria bacterium]